MKKFLVFTSILYLFAVIFISFNYFPHKFIKFSDAAKFADIARNIQNGSGFVTNFTFFNDGVFTEGGQFNAPFTSPAMPYAISFFYNLFGISDFAVIMTSTIFLLISVFIVNLLGTKLFNKTVGIAASLVLLFDLSLWNYANSGASESLFILEIVLVPYLLLFKKRTTNIIALLTLVLMYFTRPQAFIFIATFLLFYFLLNFQYKKALIKFCLVLLVGFILDMVILRPLNGRYHLYSVLARGGHAIVQHSQYVAVSDVIRGVEEQKTSIVLTIKKAGTHLFNFYRSMPNILNPYLFIFTLLSPFVFKIKEQKHFLITVFFSTVLSLVVPALTIPFYRYIHPVLPLVYIVGVASFYSVVMQLVTKDINFYTFKISKKIIPSLFTILFVMISTIILSIGTLIHDTKYYEVRVNQNKPPEYYQLSMVLKENTEKQDFILTNLDTWGGWYGERKTVWFPLEPKQIINPETGNIPFDAIYLTSYLIDDENYYMGESWRQIFENPEFPEMWTCEGCDKIRQEFELKGNFIVPANETYEKTEATAVLFTKKVQ